MFGVGGKLLGAGMGNLGPERFLGPASVHKRTKRGGPYRKDTWGAFMSRGVSDGGRGGGASGGKEFMLYGRAKSARGVSKGSATGLVVGFRRQLDNMGTESLFIVCAEK